jgi:WS/DGAT/MGAT family acyltransferase
MKTLSGLDASFLYLETPDMPMHVGSLHLYELPKGFKGSFTKLVQQHIQSRLHLAPPFTRQLAFMPFDMGHPAWVEAPVVDVAFHIRKVTMPKGASVRDVEAMCAKLHAELIDRTHPLWEFYVFERFADDSITTHKGHDPKRLAAFYSKIHHAALDGQGGSVLANAVLDLTEIPREVPPPDPNTRAIKLKASEQQVGKLVGAVFSNTLAQYAKIVRALPQAAASVGGTVMNAAKRSATANTASRGSRLPVQIAPKTAFNQNLTPARTFSTVSLPFGECRAMGKAVGASFNDIVLWLCATALRDYLKEHGGIPAKPLIAAMPVSLREASNTELNNQASMSLVNLGTHIAHPMKRLQAIMESTAAVKASLANLKSVIPTDYPGLLAPWLVGGLTKLVSNTGLIERLPAVANLVISNVPGPNVPLYMAGARMLTFHPLSIVTHGMGLNITIQTYAGSVDFGIVADKKAAPQLQHLAKGLRDAFAQAQALMAAAAAAQAAPPSAPAKKAVRRAASRKTSK